MRLNIREQLGALVLFCSLIALAVVAIATVRSSNDSGPPSAIYSLNVQ